MNVPFNSSVGFNLKVCLKFRFMVGLQKLESVFLQIDPSIPILVLSQHVNCLNGQHPPVLRLNWCVLKQVGRQNNEISQIISGNWLSSQSTIFNIEIKDQKLLIAALHT